MKKTTVFLVLFVSLALVCPALAQPGGGMGMGGGMGGRIYNPQTVTTVKGTVEKLEELTMGRSMAFREFRLKTDQGSLLVYLGPGWFLDEKKFAVKAGDAVEVTGSQVTLNNQPALIAREVKANDTTLKLRDDQGLPVWRGMGRGTGGGAGQCPAL
jgi:preprotein translocase subunit SecG